MSQRPDGSESSPSPTEPAAPAAARSIPRYDDEISLRELYLVLRRGTPLILAVTVVAVLAGALFGWLRPKTYEAEAVVEYTPATIVTGGDNSSLQFDPTTGLSFPAYTSLAMASDVMRTVLASAGDAIRDVDGVSGLRDRLEAERVSGPDQASQLSPLTVTHRAAAGSPDAAARLAGAWSAATLDAVRAWVRNGHAVEEGAAATDPARAEAALEAARAERAEFLVRDDRLLIEARLTGLIARAATTDASIETLQRDLAAAEARAAALAVASDARAEAEAEAAALAAALETARSDAASYAEAAAELRARLVRLDAEADAVDAAVARAEAALAGVGGDAGLRVSAPRIRLLSEPTPPSGSVGTSPLVIALVAGIVAMLAATLFVFLREAVRAPEGV